MRIQWDDGKKRTSFSGLFLSTFFSTLPHHSALSLQLFFPLSWSSVVLRPCSPFILFALFFNMAIVSLCFYGLCNFTNFPVYRVSREFKNSSRIELVQKFFDTVMSSSKLPLDCDELVRKFLRSVIGVTLPPPLDTLAGLNQFKDHDAHSSAQHSTPRKCNCHGWLPGMPT